MRKLIHDITFAVFTGLIFGIAVFLLIFLAVMGIPQ